MDSIRGIFVTSLLLFAILFAGCSQLGKTLNQEELIEKARELGFDTEILTALYNEFKENSSNQEIIKLLTFHIEALMREKPINEFHKKLADTLAGEIKAIGPINETFFEDYQTFNR